ncbi:hypothetical protein Pint_04376 [Pistacia integerrima]|uniref:Uncharacterized protein n=1 Tax=Pistacia integerrima TaxID=434235 RepID=A0ACC0Z7U3_9ROSI|nr:hypothetical protein Pint_04376 [Pistacia integerrima]
MGSLPFFASICTLILLSILEFSSAADKITSGQSIRDDETLISLSQRFELGFFSPGNSKNRYLGIWYKMTPQEVVWVANRNNPIPDKTGVLTISSNGSLLLINEAQSIFWSSNSSRMPANPEAQLLDSGNFVLRDSNDRSSENYIWQSFDYPSDTLLTGMKLGWNLKTNFQRNLTSWRSADDPSPGDYSLKLEVNDVPQLVLFSRSKIVARSGPWNGLQFGGIPMMQNYVFKPKLVHNEDELYYMYDPFNDTVLTRLTVNQSTGKMQRFVSNVGSREWDSLYSWPFDICDNYEQCGANSYCRVGGLPMCECLKGFVTKPQDEWGTPQTTTCVKKPPVGSDCRNGEGFLKIARMKLPDDNWSNQSMNTKECRAECLKNCSCRAYANSDIRRKGSGCLMWFGDLTDMKECSAGISWGQDIFIRVPASELVNHSYKKKIMMIVVTVVSIIFCMFLLGLLVYKAWKKTRSKGNTFFNLVDFNSEKVY